jgi:hypothetical protein
MSKVAPNPFRSTEMRCMARATTKRGGIYNVLHRVHRPPHKAILQEGESFPDCRRCGTAVVFEFLEPVIEGDEVEHIGYDPDFMDSILRTFAKAG